MHEHNISIKGTHVFGYLAEETTPPDEIVVQSPTGRFRYTNQGPAAADDPDSTDDDGAAAHREDTTTSGVRASDLEGSTATSG